MHTIFQTSWKIMSIEASHIKYVRNGQIISEIMDTPLVEKWNKYTSRCSAI